MKDKKGKLLHLDIWDKTEKSGKIIFSPGKGESLIDKAKELYKQLNDNNALCCIVKNKFQGKIIYSVDEALLVNNKVKEDDILKAIKLTDFLNKIDISILNKCIFVQKQ